MGSDDTTRIIHRDFKPSDVILSLGVLVSIGFGIARSCDTRVDIDARRFRTRAYVPLEQFGFDQSDIRFDLHAFEFVLHYVLAAIIPI